MRRERIHPRVRRIRACFCDDLVADDEPCRQRRITGFGRASFGLQLLQLDELATNPLVVDSEANEVRVRRRFIQLRSQRHAHRQKQTGGRGNVVTDQPIPGVEDCIHRPVNVRRTEHGFQFLVTRRDDDERLMQRIDEHVKRRRAFFARGQFVFAVRPRISCLSCSRAAGSFDSSAA